MLILDRYVLTTFLKNYLISFGVLMGMYVTLDVVMNFDELFAFGQKGAAASGMESAFRALRNVGDFYLFQSIVIFVQLSPVIPVVAAAFTLIRMTRFNELIATLASGVSLRRTAMPIFIAGFVLTAATGLAQEAVIPAIIPKLLRDHQDVGREARRSFPIKALEDARGSILIAAVFNPPTLTAPATMSEVDLVFRDEQRRPIGHVVSSKAIWNEKDRNWTLVGGLYSQGLLPDQVRTPEREVRVLDTTLTPDEITLYRSRDYVELLSTRRINELLAQPRNYGVAELLRVKHFRVAQYLNNFILLMLAIPCVMSREPRSLKTGGVFLLGVVGSYLGTVFMAQHLAGTPAPTESLAAHWPALMAALPIFLFGPLAILAVDRIRT